MHSQARYYDLLAGLLTFGRERAFRERLVDVARITEGESVLDVGCGTGTLAIAAKRRAGVTGVVTGIDASSEMIDLAEKKAAKAGVDVSFRNTIAEALPFPDSSFDVVLSTLMLHHLPRGVREQCAREMRRVLKPGGRILAVDFSAPAHKQKGILGHLHRHGHVAPADIVSLLNDAGLAVIETGSAGVSDLQFVLCTTPGAGDAVLTPVSRSLGPLPAPMWPLLLGVLALVAAHLFMLSAASSALKLTVAGSAGLAILFLALHSGFLGAVYALLRRRPHRHSKL